jgi:hypothetical protein
MAVRFDELFAAIDAKPFRPFKIELVSGTQVEVAHPENIFVLPTRHNVHNIQVYQDEPYAMSLIWPEGMVRLLYPAKETPSAG